MPRIMGVWVVLLGLAVSGPVCPAAAEQYSIKQMTPEVQTALDGRRDRYQRLEDLKGQGMVGEDNRGYVRAFGTDPAVVSLVDAENQDRRIIYQTIARQNKLTGALQTIEQVFAQEQRERARPGVKVQSPDGSWITK